jgi:hypothetical protein
MSTNFPKIYTKPPNSRNQEGGMERVPYSGPTIRECSVYLTFGALTAQYMWSNTHFCMCAKIYTKYSDAMPHRIKCCRPGDRDLCTMTLNYPSVRKMKNYLPFLMPAFKVWWNSLINGTRMHTAHYSELFKFYDMFTSPFFNHLNAQLNPIC